MTTVAHSVHVPANVAPLSLRSVRSLAGVAMLCLLMALGLAGCGQSADARVRPAGPDGWPAVLHMSYQPSEEDVEGRMDRLQEFVDYLGEKIGIPVDLVQAQGYGPTIEAMRAEKIDIARTGSFAYMIAHEKAGAQAIITRGTESGGPGLYRSIIVTSPETGIGSLAELKARSRELVFAFVDPASTSGHLIPRAGLEQQGFVPQEDFERIVFSMSHTNSAMALVSAKVDAGAMSRTTYDRLVAAGRIAPDDLVILWESAPIPTGPIIVRAGLPEEIKERIRAAYLELNELGGPLLETLREQAQTPDMIFYAAEDSMWDGLREIAYKLETMQLLERG
ncbi:MAG: phosphate/phosphite/phosphonate ABC transporter substrate-binding protein [Pseudomonadales bacterium]|jgi:phosphonate transport system substrate-binding protein|nr:phosphate/phosphite/phosphonate ABC transporter substrate-binding protein [Pseudomonadales bacterium]